MDVDSSPVPITSSFSSFPYSSGKAHTLQTPHTPGCSVLDPTMGYGTQDREDSSYDSETSDPDSSAQQHHQQKEIERCAPSAMKLPNPHPAPFTPKSAVVPDESAERMNELANQYRKQGS